MAILQLEGGVFDLLCDFLKPIKKVMGIKVLLKIEINISSTYGTRNYLNNYRETALKFSQRLHAKSNNRLQELYLYYHNG